TNLVKARKAIRRTRLRLVENISFVISVAIARYAMTLRVSWLLFLLLVQALAQDGTPIDPAPEELAPGNTQNEPAVNAQPQISIMSPEGRAGWTRSLTRSFSGYPKTIISSVKRLTRRRQ